MNTFLKNIDNVDIHSMTFNICHSRPEKESTKVEEEAAEMEDKVSDAEEESSEQRAKSNLKEVNNLSDL